MATRISAEQAVPNGLPSDSFSMRVEQLVRRGDPSFSSSSPITGWQESLLGLGVVSVFCLTTAVLMSAWAFLPALLGWDSTAIVSNSMAPRVERGDVVVFGSNVADPVDPGAVIRFFVPGEEQAIVHRVTETNHDGAFYVTQGDANAVVDSDAVAFSAVQGVGVLLVPLVGYPVVWVTEQNVVALVLFLLGAAAIIWSAHGVLSAATTPMDGPNRGPIAGPVVMLASRQPSQLIPGDLRARLGIESAQADD